MAMSAEGILYSWGTGSLSHSTCNQTLLVPTPVAASLLLGSRFRRGGGLPALHAIAFCLGTHLRLSKASVLTQQEGDNKGCPYQSFADDMLKHIVEYSSILTGAYVHMSESLPAGSAHESNLMACALGNAAEESSLQDTGESRRSSLGATGEYIRRRVCCFCDFITVEGWPWHVDRLQLP